MRPGPGLGPDSFSVSAPSKSFWLGEYSVLKGKPALVAAHAPRFRLSGEVLRGSIGSDSDFPFALESPAGLLWQHVGKPTLKLSFKDGSEGGGFGASTAQFLLLYRIFSERGFLKGESSWTAAYTCYRELTKGEAIPPSGADLVSQWRGGLTLFNPSDQTARDVLTSQIGPSVLIFSAAHQVARKTKTHEHLAGLSESFLSEGDAKRLEEITLKGVRAIEAGDASGLGKSFHETAEMLWNLGLESKEAHEDRKAIESFNGVLGAKGMGARLSDGLVVVVDLRLSVSSRQELIGRIESERGLQLLSNGFVPERGVQAQAFRVKAPSNIAVIKYMGKEGMGKESSQPSAPRNRPLNPSLSLTLDSLCTRVEIERIQGSGPEKLSDRFESPFSEKAKTRYLAHLDFLRREVPAVFERVREKGGALIGFQDSALRIRSENSFPEGVGIASSASAFAALTLGGALAFANEPKTFQSEYEKPESPLKSALAELSRQGSGSSCRSFDGPWVYWEGQGAHALKTSAAAIPELSDLVVQVSAQPKAVSSSEAHSRVLTSSLWKGRTERVAKRMAEIRKILAGEGTAVASKSSETPDPFSRFAALVLEEALDMHSLFESADPPFSYRNSDTKTVLSQVSLWLEQGWPESLGPAAVTLDAGPNVHFLVPKAKRTKWEQFLKEAFPHFKILADDQGKGAEIMSLC